VPFTGVTGGDAGLGTLGRWLECNQEGRAGVSDSEGECNSGGRDQEDPSLKPALGK
jgi:hypothetical protein